MFIDQNLERLPDVNGIVTFRAPAGIPPRFVMFVLVGKVSEYGKVQAVDADGRVIASAE